VRRHQLRNATGRGSSILTASLREESPTQIDPDKLAYEKSIRLLSNHGLPGRRAKSQPARRYREVVNSLRIAKQEHRASLLIKK